MGRDGRYMVRSGGLYRLFRKQANCLSPFREGTEKVPLPHKNGNNTRLKSCICQYFFVPLHKNKAYVTATERT